LQHPAGEKKAGFPSTNPYFPSGNRETHSNQFEIYLKLLYRDLKIYKILFLDFKSRDFRFLMKRHVLLLFYNFDVLYSICGGAGMNNAVIPQ
jgi:hypothetical protein